MEGSLDDTGVVTDLEAWQDGLMVALLAAAPMRIANFAALRLGLHHRAPLRHVAPPPRARRGAEDDCAANAQCAGCRGRSSPRAMALG